MIALLVLLGNVHVLVEGYRRTDAQGNIEQRNMTGPLTQIVSKKVRLTTGEQGTYLWILIPNAAGDAIFAIQPLSDRRLFKFELLPPPPGKDTFLMTRNWSTPIPTNFATLDLLPLLTADGAYIILDNLGSFGTSPDIFIFNAMTGQYLGSLPPSPFLNRTYQIVQTVDKDNQFFVAHAVCNNSNPIKIFLRKYDLYHPDFPFMDSQEFPAKTMEYICDNYMNPKPSLQRIDLTPPSASASTSTSASASASGCNSLVLWTMPRADRIANESKWMKAFAVDTLALCWEEMLTPLTYSTIAGFIVDEERGVLYTVGTWGLGTGVLVAYKVTPIGLTQLSQFILPDWQYDNSVALALHHSTDSILVQYFSVVDIKVFTRCPAATSPCDLRLRLVIDNIGDMIALTPNALYTAYKGGEIARAYDLSNGKPLWKRNPDYVKEALLTSYGVLITRTYFNTDLFGEILTEETGVASSSYKTAKVLFIINYCIVGVALFLAVFFLVKQRKTGRLLEGDINPPSGRENGERKRCCDGYKKYPLLTLFKLLSLTFQLIVCIMALSDQTKAGDLTDQVMQPLTPASASNFRSQYLENCPNPAGKPVAELCFCIHNQGDSPFCQPDKCGRSSAPPPLCSSVAQDLCRCDASFFDFSCGTECDYSSPNCSNTNVQFDYSSVLSAPLQAFTSCTDYYHRAVNKLRGLAIMHILVVILSLCLSNTNFLNFPIAFLQLLAAIFGWSILPSVHLNGNVCTGADGVLAGIPGCIWREKGAGRDYQSLELTALEALKKVKNDINALNNIALGGALFAVVYCLHRRWHSLHSNSNF